MKYLYVLSVDIKAKSQLFSYEQFLTQVSSCLTCLEALKGAFDPSPCSIAYCPPDVQWCNTELKEYSAHASVMISIGKVRAQHLLQLYHEIARLIMFDLPNFEVNYQVSVFEFSS